MQFVYIFQNRKALLSSEQSYGTSDTIPRVIAVKHCSGKATILHSWIWQCPNKARDVTVCRHFQWKWNVHVIWKRQQTVSFRFCFSVPNPATAWIRRCSLPKYAFHVMAVCVDFAGVTFPSKESLLCSLLKVIG